MTNLTRGKIVNASSTLLCVGTPIAAACTQFPIWVQKSSEATVSGMVLLVLFIACIPFYKYIKDYMKSPSAAVVWTVLAVLFTLLQEIIKQMIIVTYVAAAANIVGTGMYKIGDYLKARPDKIKEINEEAVYGEFETNSN
jgi:hypothetical protein